MGIQALNYPFIIKYLVCGLSEFVSLVPYQYYHRQAGNKQRNTGEESEIYLLSVLQ